MDRAHAAIVLADESVLHVVGKLTESAFAFVSSTSQALGDNGVPQTVILIEEPPNPTMLAKFHPAVRLELPAANAGPVARFKHAVRVLCREAAARPVAAIHLHGLLPSAVAVYAAWFCGLSPKRFLLPHGSRLLGVLRGASALIPMTRHQALPAPAGTPPAEADPEHPIALVEHRVDARFFGVERHESPRPLVVAGNLSADDPMGAAQFAQLAVLFGEESMAMALNFNWVGRVGAESRARLKAANVGIFDDLDVHGRADKLADAWIYVAYATTSQDFPLLLAEAMALGLPCVAWDTPQTRQVLRHGETGLLCNSPSQLLTSIAQLIDSPELRRNMGRSAQEDAARRFHPAQLRDLLQSPA